MSFISSFVIAIVVIFLSLFYFIYWYFERSFNYWTKRYVGHPKPSFPFGNFNRKILTESGIIIQNIYNELRSTKAKYGGYNMLTIPVFMPLSPNLYKEILIKNFNCFHDHGIYCDEENDPLSAHIISMSGSKWKYLRNKLSPTLTTAKLKLMFDIMKKCSTNLSDIMDQSVKIEIHDIAIRYTSDIICSCAFGIEGNCLKNPKSEFLEHGRQLVETSSIIDSLRMTLGVLAPQILQMFKIRFFNPKSTSFFHRIVQETVEYRVKNNIKRNDLMDMLIRLMNNENIDDTGDENNIKTDEGLTMNQIAAQVFIFYLAGFETTATTLTFCMYELAKNTDMQHKLREEILNVLQENNGEITFEALNNMPYADKVLQETMRMYPPIVMLNRVCTEKFTIPDSVVTIDTGTRVVISTLGVHYDPEFYPDPYNFDPERFTEEEKAKRPQMTYFPFGDGPRVCLGQKFAMVELKLALVEFLRNYKFSVHSATKPKIRTISNGNMLGLKDKIWLEAKKL